MSLTISYFWSQTLLCQDIIELHQVYFLQLELKIKLQLNFLKNGI